MRKFLFKLLKRETNTVISCAWFQNSLIGLIGIAIVQNSVTKEKKAFLGRPMCENEIDNIKHIVWGGEEIKLAAAEKAMEGFSFDVNIKL